MKLRNWQSECIYSAISKYEKGQRHFLTLATPGAGKTHMASVLADKMHRAGLIDIVMCFSPSSVVASDFSDALKQQFGTHFDGTIGALGDSYTYQKLSSLPESIWGLFERFRIFVIFDEIHHCAGSNEGDSNSWGAPIIDRIKDRAAYTIALTGTPWRSDKTPIVLSNYCGETGKIQCDYIYGLKQAIKDGVCRVPQIVALDNDQIQVMQNNKDKSFTSFGDLLSAKVVPYSAIVKNDQVIEQLLKLGVDKLDQIRTVNTKAGGLVVSSSIYHAQQIKAVMKSLYGESPIIVTSEEAKPDQIIKRFRKSNDKWLISVGMVSEGTNIPRLQVCCMLTNVKTEMYFRQILGRPLRATDAPNKEAFLFMPAEPSLLEYAQRVAEDIPGDASNVKLVPMEGTITTEIGSYSDNNSVVSETAPDGSSESHVLTVYDIEETIDNNGYLAEPKDLERAWTMGIIGAYNHTNLEINELELLHISSNSYQRLAQLSRG